MLYLIESESEFHERNQIQDFETLLSIHKSLCEKNNLDKTIWMLGNKSEDGKITGGNFVIQEKEGNQVYLLNDKIIVKFDELLKYGDKKKNLYITMQSSANDSEEPKTIGAKIKRSFVTYWKKYKKWLFLMVLARILVIFFLYNYFFANKTKPENEKIVV